MAQDTARSPALAFALIACSTVLGIAGTDLVLPAMPSLPAALGGTATEAQFVLASFVAGAALGLLGFGELGARLDSRILLVGSLTAYGLVSLGAALSPNLTLLIAVRFVQGASGSAAAVFAPGMIRLLFDERRATRMLGLLGSLELLMPALAPIAGAALLARFGWSSSFWLTGALALALAAAMAALARSLPRVVPGGTGGGYPALLRDPAFMRYALSQALCLGGLLVIVFGAPVVFTGAMGGTLSDFILFQVTGVAVFILGANLSGRVGDLIGTEPLILGGTLLSAAGVLAILLYGVAGGTRVPVIVAIWSVVNLGFGLRGPSGFMRAVVAARGDDARGAALVILAILVASAAGTALAAPFITQGLVPLAAVASAVSLGAVLCLLVLPRLDQDSGAVGRGGV